MGQIQSLDPAAQLLTLRDGQAFQVVLFTGLGRNGVRTFRLRARGTGAPVDLTGIAVGDLRMVIKSSPDALPTELGAFPIVANVTVAGAGEFTVDFATIDFVNPADRVLLVLYNDNGGTPIVLSQMQTSIEKAGI